MLDKNKTMKPVYTFEPKTLQEKINNIECCLSEMEDLVSMIKFSYRERFEKFMDKPNYVFWERKLNNGSFYNIEKLYNLGSNFGLGQLIFKIRCDDIIKLSEEIKNERTCIEK
jgi:hypothetical protein